MSFFPSSFDPRADAFGVLSLVNVNTVDGDFGFILGEDGKFTDTTGKVWWGATIIESPQVDLAIGGVAPSGQIGMSFFQDPDAPDLVAQVRALGSDYIRGRELSLWVQPLVSVNSLYAPEIAPLPVTSFEMRSITASATGPMMRRLSLSFETVFAGRNTARGWFYTTADHAKLTGSENISLSRMPTDARTEEKLF